jgi:Na+-translocating ferredoxin:NAD+ oxidoreductase subunit B
MKKPGKSDPQRDRRSFLRRTLGLISSTALGGALGFGSAKISAQPLVWQIDPDKCTRCEKCATECVLAPSAVKCLNAHELCGYCEQCFAFFKAGWSKEKEERWMSSSPLLPQWLEVGSDESPEDASYVELCPVHAIRRRHIRGPYYEYMIDSDACLACGRCVTGCALFGNGAMYLQINHELCVNCNECAIAKACPSDAFVRIPASTPYVPRTATKPGKGA